MYFKQLSMETLNESNQLDVFPDHYPSTVQVSSSPTLIDKLSSAGQKLSNMYNQYKENVNGQNVFKNTGEKMFGSAADNFNPNIASTVSDASNNGAEGSSFVADAWDAFTDKLTSIYNDIKTSGTQYMTDHQQGINRTGGFIAGFLSKFGFDAIMNRLFPPEVQNVAQDSDKMSSLMSAGIGAAATAGVLGLIWLFKKWKNKGQVTDQDIQYAAQLNQMRPEEIPEEDKNKPISA